MEKDKQESADGLENLHTAKRKLQNPFQGKPPIQKKKASSSSKKTAKLPPQQEKCEKPPRSMELEARQGKIRLNAIRNVVAAPGAVLLNTKKGSENNPRASKPSTTEEHRKSVGTLSSEHKFQGKTLAQWLATICQVAQTAKNEQNANSRYAREKLEVIHEEVRTQTVVLREGFAKVCETMQQSLSQSLKPVDTANDDAVDRNCIPMDFVDACTAMVRYAYALSGQGKGTPLHLFPSRIAQLKLFRTVIQILVETRTASSKLDGIMTGTSVEKDGIHEKNSLSSEKADIECVVDRLLESRIMRNEKETKCIPGEYNQKNGNVKNTVLDRLLDQRRRYHESVTLPLVLSWLRVSGFAGYDSSKALKKQSSAVFEAAADAFERNEEGISAYCDEDLYGRSYQAACLALQSASETFGENALGYVKKLIPDDDELASVILDLEAKIGCQETVLGKRRFSHNSATDPAFYPHHLAFVFTKVSARLQVLSRCKFEGGRGVRQVEKGHLREFLCNAIDFDSTLLAAITENQKSTGKDQQNALHTYHLLGVPLKPLPTSVRREFEIALNGWSATPAVRMITSTNPGENSVETAVTKEPTRLSDANDEELGSDGMEEGISQSSDGVESFIDEQSEGSNVGELIEKTRRTKRFENYGIGNVLADMFDAEQKE